MSVEIQELTAEVGEEAQRQEANRRDATVANPQKLQKTMRLAAARRDWARERLQP